MMAMRTAPIRTIPFRVLKKGRDLTGFKGDGALSAGAGGIAPLGTGVWAAELPVPERAGAPRSRSRLDVLGDVARGGPGVLERCFSGLGSCRRSVE